MRFDNIGLCERQIYENNPLSIPEILNEIIMPKQQRGFNNNHNTAFSNFEYWKNKTMS